MSRISRRLPRELRQQRAFTSAAAEAVLSLFRTSDLAHRHVEALVAPEGLTLPQYNVLRILRGAEPEGLCTLAIADRMIQRAPGITRLLDRLERARLVTRTRSDKDRREVRCRITRPGLAVLARLDPALKADDDILLGSLSQRELETLITLLDRVRDALDPALPDE